jgi:hypothetical protein
MTVLTALKTRVFPQVLLVSLVFLGLGVMSQPAYARGKIPVIVQLTNNTTGGVEWPRIRSQDGDRIIFLSTGDVMGAGSETGLKQLYLYDFDGVESNAGVMTQITNDPGYGVVQASRSTDDVFASGRPDIIPFISSADLDPLVDNSDHNPEVFLYHITDHQGLAGQFQQLTDTVAPVVNANVYGSDSGKCIVFDSNADLNDNTGDDTPNNPGTGFQNPDGSREVFLYSVNTTTNYPYDGNFTQVSNGPADTTSYRPVIGGYWFPRQCQSTVYMSDHDQTGEAVRTGQHIYVFHRPSGTNEAMTAPETPNGQPSNGIYENPNISAASPFARGPFSVFTTDADLWNNGLQGIHQLYRYRIFHPRQTLYTAMTDGRIVNPVISDGGGLIAFQATGEVFNPDKIKSPHSAPTNGDGNSEIFFQKGRRKITQVTSTIGCENEQPSLRDNGTSIAFRSTCDLVQGNNPGGLEQVFLYIQVKTKSTLACKKSSIPCECEVAEGCCNIANGCLDMPRGASVKPPKKNCVDKGKCPSS